MKQRHTAMHRRLEVLERCWTSEPITLHFADGSTSTIPARRRGRDSALEFFRAVLGGERCPELDPIAAAVRIDEPEGHMCELAQALYLSPRTLDEEKGIFWTIEFTCSNEGCRLAPVSDAS